MRWAGRARLRTAAVAAALITTVLPTTPAVADDTTWEAFLADRVTLLEQLAPPIVDCFQRRDSAIDPLSPIFHGCLDWHSAVHAAYSHHALSANTGDDRYHRLVDDKIAPAGVSLVPAEHLYQQAKAPDYLLSENPYGFGWFLVLAREREITTGQDDLRGMADYAAAQMVKWFQQRLDRDEVRTYVLTPTHANYSWSLLNLDIWAKHTGDADLQAAVERFGEPLKHARYDSSCPASRDTGGNLPGFQPICLMRLTAIWQIWGEQAGDFVRARVPDDLSIAPVTEPSSCHAGGQNFLRAYALYRLHEATGDLDLRDNAAELIRYHVSRPDLYIDRDYLGDPGYLCYSHWVAQLGVRAISLSFGGV
ncbi:MAG TPA: DUF2891 family protein [Egibacteraceae bacterium]|nr:DUF2891 family protein [Egibacteraceae bacterium]